MRNQIHVCCRDRILDAAPPKQAGDWSIDETCQSTAGHVDTGRVSRLRWDSICRALTPSCHNAKQLGSTFIDGRGEHALGLDARLAATSDEYRAELLGFEIEEEDDDD